jgi:hypothetical protein
MTTVYLYGGEGTFAGTGEFQWNSPAIGSTHKLILFLTQEVTEPQEQLAMDELAKYGFRNVQVGAGKPIAAEVLNEPQMKVFQKHYEGALAEGSSIVWYP